MAVDAIRVQAVLMAGLQVDDPVDQAAILDWECASDIEVRHRVEALLRAYQGPATIIDPASATPFDGASASLANTMAFDPTADQSEVSVTTSMQNQIAEPVGPHEDDQQPALEFLQPSAKPGSLGRLGHHEVLEVLGRGGFGIVGRACDESLHRVVAIKVLSLQLASTA